VNEGRAIVGADLDAKAATGAIAGKPWANLGVSDGLVGEAGDVTIERPGV
jgi:hypothetical protein